MFTAVVVAMRNVSRRSVPNAWFQRRLLCGNVTMPPFELSEDDSNELLQVCVQFESIKSGLVQFKELTLLSVWVVERVYRNQLILK